MENRLLDVQGVADLLGVSQCSVWRLREAGEMLPAVHIGGCVRWRLWWRFRVRWTVCVCSTLCPNWVRYMLWNVNRREPSCAAVQSTRGQVALSW